MKPLFIILQSFLLLFIVSCNSNHANEYENHIKFMNDKFDEQSKNLENSSRHLIANIEKTVAERDSLYYEVEIAKRANYIYSSGLNVINSIDSLINSSNSFTFKGLYSGFEKFINDNKPDCRGRGITPSWDYFCYSQNENPRDYISLAVDPENITLLKNNLHQLKLLVNQLIHQGILNELQQIGSLDYTFTAFDPMIILNCKEYRPGEKITGTVIVNGYSNYVIPKITIPDAKIQSYTSHSTFEKSIPKQIKSGKYQLDINFTLPKPGGGDTTMMLSTEYSIK